MNYINWFFKFKSNLHSCSNSKVRIKCYFFLYVAGFSFLIFFFFLGLLYLCSWIRLSCNLHSFPDTSLVWNFWSGVDGFPGSSAGKESACNAGDPSLMVQFLGREDPWRRNRLPTPVFLGFPVGQMVKNLSAMWEAWAWSLGWEDPLEEGMVTHSSILAWRIPMDRGAWQSMGLQRVKHDLLNKHSTPRRCSWFKI